MSRSRTAACSFIVREIMCYIHIQGEVKAERALCMFFCIPAAQIIWFKVTALHVFIRTLFSANDHNKHNYLACTQHFHYTETKALRGLYSKGRQAKEHMQIVLKWSGVRLFIANIVRCLIMSIMIKSQLQLAVCMHTPCGHQLCSQLPTRPAASSPLSVSVTSSKPFPFWYRINSMLLLLMRPELSAEAH